MTESVPAPRVYAVPVDHVTPLPVQPGGDALLRGSARTSFDGSSYDAVTYFELAAGGLQVAASAPAPDPVYRVVPTGEPGPGCVAFGVPSPCLVPRLETLAHDRLLTQREFAATLSGTLEAETREPPPVPMWITSRTGKATTGLLALIVVTTAVVLVVRRIRRGSLVAQVHAAAREARGCLRGDPTLTALDTQVTRLLARAAELESARRACRARLSSLDRGSVAKKRAALIAANTPEANEALTWLDAEASEAAQLEADLAEAKAGLERIAAALRVLVLRVRPRRGAAPRSDRHDPVNVLAEELALRDAALAEVDA